MSAVQKTNVHQTQPRHGSPASPGIVAVTGQWTIHQLQRLIAFISIAAAALWQSCRLMTWRRTVRTEFFHQCHQVGTRALSFIVLTALIAGLGIVFETLYWLKVFGQSEFAGSLLVVVLIREIAPLLVALIVIGRSVSVIMIELGIMLADGQIRMLDAQGIDPFIYLLVPRVMAVAVCMFSLTIVFTVVTLAAGFVAVNALSGTNLTVYDFIFEILSAMGPADFAAIPVTTLSIGFVTGLIGCTTGLSFSGVALDVHDLLPSGIMKSVIATLSISLVVTLLL
ncbi:MAG: ABC transporter permease [Desulfobacterales bacterium]|jgi:phospholipid/cholesterol/gamma-HCH transport system permease protein